MHSYREFWPFYVSQHLKPGTRLLHFIGTTAVIACVLQVAVERTYGRIAVPLASLADTLAAACWRVVREA